jgi:hypothetical protein
MARLCCSSAVSIIVPSASHSRANPRVCWGDPKLRNLLKFLAEFLVLQEEEILIWCEYPAMQLLIPAYLRALNISACCHSSDMAQAERTQCEAVSKPRAREPDQEKVEDTGYNMVLREPAPRTEPDAEELSSEQDVLRQAFT